MAIFLNAAGAHVVVGTGIGKRTTTAARNLSSACHLTNVHRGTQKLLIESHSHPTLQSTNHVTAPLLWPVSGTRCGGEMVLWVWCVLPKTVRAG
jgi:hypothetical protein